MSSLLKGAVLSRKLPRFSAHTSQSEDFVSHSLVLGQKRAGPRPHAILLWMGQGLSKFGSRFSNVPAQNVLKGYLHFLLFVRSFHGSRIRTLCRLKKSVALMVFELSARKKGRRKPSRVLLSTVVSTTKFG